MAYLLREKGFNDVTVIEESNRIGGKANSLPVRGTKQQVSVVYWTNDYNDTLLPLLEKYGFLDHFSSAPSSDQIIWTMDNPTVSQKRNISISRSGSSKCHNHVSIPQWLLFYQTWVKKCLYE